MRKLILGLLAVGLAAGVAAAWSKPTPPAEFPAPTQPPIVQVVADVPRQEAAVSLVWTPPAEARVGKAARYGLAVTNTSNQIVQKVTVQVRVPAGVAAAGVNPAAKTIDGILLWELGTLRPNEVRQLAADFTPSARGALTAEAWVTFTGTAATTVAVKQPRIDVTVTAPKTAPIGSAVVYRYVIKNTGDVAVSGVRFEQRHLSPPPPAEATVTVPPTADPVVPPLAPGQEFVVTRQLPATGRGDLHVGFDVTADGGLAATTASRTKVLAPRLAVAVRGPAQLGLSKGGEYVVRVTNTGDLPAEFVAVTCAAGGGIDLPTPYDSGERTIEALKPGETKEFTWTGFARSPGEVFVKARAVEQLPQGCPRPAATAGGECKTAVRGVPGIRMEVTDTVDPVPVRGETVYEVKVTNTGTEPDRNLTLSCELPAGAELVTATGPTTYLERIGVDFNRPDGGRQMRRVGFEPVRELGPRTEVVFRVRVKLGAAGDGRFRAAITSDHLTAPLTREESTTVYGN